MIFTQVECEVKKYTANDVAKAARVVCAYFAVTNIDFSPLDRFSLSTLFTLQELNNLVDTIVDCSY